MTRPFTLAAAAAVGLSAGAAKADDMFIVHSVDMERAAAVAAVREKAEADADWLFLAEFGLAGGSVTALKICYLPIGPDIIAAGMHVMAMMPCGHMAFYEGDDGGTRLSMLDLGFMTALSDAPSLEAAVEAGSPAFAALLAETLGVD